MPDQRVRQDDVPALPGRRVSRWGVRTRLLTAILLVALTTLTAGVIGVERMSVLSAQTEQLYTQGSVPLRDLQALQVSWWTTMTYESRKNIPGGGPVAHAHDLALHQQWIATTRQRAEQVAKLPLTPTAQRQVAIYRKAQDEYFPTSDVLTKAFEAGDVKAAAGYIAQLQAFEKTAVTAINAAVAEQTAVAEAARARARHTYESARTLTIGIVLAGLLISLALALLMARSVTRPVEEMRRILDLAASGDLRARVTAPGGDELGAAGASLNATLNALADLLRLIRESASDLATSSTAMSGTASAMASNAESAARQAETIRSSAGEVALSVDTISAGSSEMQEAIREIALNANQAATVARRGVSVAESTTVTVGELGDSSDQIASVVKLINAIAAQTNLLALNATIEAARAGDAGKGFAVVATEVKELARETARATDDIAGRVQVIQAQTGRAVEAISEISAVMVEINDYQASIAAAVEEQTATTNEMNRNVVEAAGGSRSIADGVSGLAANAAQTNVQVTHAQSGSTELARMGVELERAVAAYQL